ncbi:hypothetical protein RFI_34035 [Reticulomyxa filosa]|uniref:Uncharacterized protein n=1 Tax=Reticulomyxa filosa TaxID=46433 RepID=X6LRN9_RETFI|nr:hypothetical protein RFI_34035 [Reticulomyxa filosa]|eukprot:ETO03375.1 hypothetical protein RFI_34035 [Reticulomyxa filosa]
MKKKIQMVPSSCIVNPKIVEWTHGNGCEKFPATTIIQGQSMSPIKRATRTNEFSMPLEPMKKILTFVKKKKGVIISHKMETKRYQYCGITSKQENEDSMKGMMIKNKRIFGGYRVGFVLKSKKRHYVNFTFRILNRSFLMGVAMSSAGSSDTYDGNNETQSTFSFTFLSIILIHWTGIVLADIWPIIGLTIQKSFHYLANQEKILDIGNVLVALDPAEQHFMSAV